jgi:hypothetical protein
MNKKLKIGSKVDKSLLEVWEMKEKVFEDFKKSKFSDFNDFIEEEMKVLRKKHNYKYFKKTEVVEL